MSLGFERLQEIGITKIHQDTHISMSYLKSILEEDFQKISRVQLNGFISILEREYNLDLSELKDEVSQNAALPKKLAENQEDNIFLRNNKKRKMMKIYMGFVIVLLFLGAAYTVINNSQNNTLFVEDEIVDKVQEKLEKSKIVLPEKTKKTLQKQSSQPLKAIVKKEIPVKKEIIKQKHKIVKATPSIPQNSSPKTFKVFPRFKVWIGIIDVKKKTKKQRTISKAMELDGTKEWLLLLGHGKVNVEMNDKNITYHKSTNLRLHYLNGEISELNISEFKKLNNGRKW